MKKTKLISKKKKSKYQNNPSKMYYIDMQLCKTFSNVLYYINIEDLRGSQP